ncbi:hypothetical protein KJ762_12135 [bacterium]|nr:hypothetical protein [bacterium]MBU1064582.1 hypothetical protein [bacterium]MBU1635242.1 hypothetical protein [bacterium]MBU1873438.1 hypothetical protein [bacterium]
MKSKFFPINNIRRLGLLVFLIIISGSTVTRAQWHHHWTVSDRDLGTAITLDPYHSYTSLFYQIQKDQPIYIYQENETLMYRDLLLRSYKPGYGLIEFTLYPSTAVSAWIESSHKDFYDEFTVYKDINLIGSISGGYQEPWSVSLFAGQLAAFLSMNDEEELIIAASGASGLVLTGGAYQIFNNCLVRSNWYRVEWKLKGESVDDSVAYDWDLKLGYRNYGLREISNTLLLSFSRNRMHLGRFDWRWVENSMNEFELQLPVSHDETGISRFKIIYGKAIPFWKWMIGLGVGVIYENRRQYDAELKQFSPQKEKSWNLFLMPFAYW